MNGVQYFNEGTIIGANGLSKELIKKIDPNNVEAYMTKF